jgi:glutathione S-transferase
MKPTIYISPGSHHSRRVTLLIHELGLDVELIKVDVRPPGMGGENSQPPFLAINPNGKVPVLREGDFVLWESNAIMWYLAEGHGDTPLWPADRCARAQIAKWQVWQAAHLSAAADALMYEALVRPMLKQPPDQDKLTAATASLHRWAKVLDGALTATEYLTGGCVTCADLAVASALMYAPLANMPVGEHPPVRQWFERMCARPSWQATAPSA